MRVLPALMLVAAALAGCAGGTAPDPSGAPEEPQFEDATRNLTVDQPTLPVEPPTPGERGFDEVPTWRLGEWWKVRITDFFEGNAQEVHRIVAGTEQGDYLVGFPIDAFSNYAMVMHVPGYGDIRAEDLSYDTHDQPLKLLHFPLREGDSWQTKWQSAGTNITVLVEEVDDEAGRARLSISGDRSGNITYDTEMGTIQKLVVNGYGMFEVLDHGYGWSGAVRVPHAHDLVFLHGRVGGVAGLERSDPGNVAGPVPQPLGPEETILVDDFYDRVSFAIILVDIPGFVSGTSISAGYYEQTATAPDGTQYTARLTAEDQTGVKISFFEHDDPAGAWELESIAAGPGQALFEGIGYHSIDIELPSGCVLPSANSLHHVTLCKR